MLAPTPELESFYGKFLLAFQQHIMDNVPEIRYIDQDLGQLDFYNDRPAVAWPCLLVDFTDTTYDQMSNQVQWGKPMLLCRVGYPPFSASTNFAPLEVRKSALQCYELEYKLYKAIQGFTAGGICQPLTRIRENSEKRDDPYRVRASVYDTTFEDFGGQPVRLKVERPKIEIDFED